MKLCALSIALPLVASFSPSFVGRQSTSISSVSDRRDFFDTVSQAVVFTSAVGALGLPLEPANAFGGGLKKVNAQLQSYGLPQMSVPDGYSPLLQLYGKGSNRELLLVEFVHPIDWVVTLPNNDVNGEDGTIQAGEYAKGDTATFFVVPGSSKADIQSQDNDFFKNAVVKAISQKGDNIYQNFKVIKVDKKDKDGQSYALVDFKYELLTGAGFEVGRRGVASVSSVGNNVQVLWSATIDARYKKTETQLRTIAESFRVYSDGLKLAKQDTEEA